MKKYIFVFLAITLVFSSCSKKETATNRTDILDSFRNSYMNIEENRKVLAEKSISEYYDTLTEEQRIGQLLLVSLDGNSTARIDHILGANNTAPGGYLLFGFNIADTAEETILFLSSLHNAYTAEGSIPPFISIDHEGGIVNRLRNICSKLPSQLSVARKFSENEAARLYELHGKQLKNLGIHVNLAPVVEILTDENVIFLEDRSFGGLNDVITYSAAEISGMKKAGVLPVLKHFPGNTNNDPHTGLPILTCDENTLRSDFLEPFYCLDDGSVNGVLVAHTVIPSVDDRPACLSEKVISLLSSEKEFNGLVFSDDLLMKALIKNGHPVEESLIDAVNAGVNILMISTGSYDEYADILLKEYRANPDFKKKVDQSVKKILEWKVSCNLLQRKVTETGFFEYKAEVCLPSAISEQQIAERNNAFAATRDEAAELYDKIWWSR